MSGKGTKSKAYYLDDDHNIVDPDKATKVAINEFDENGIMIRETWGFVNQSPRKEKWKKREGFKWLKLFFQRKKNSV